MKNKKMLSYVRQRNRFLSGMPERKYSLHFGQTKRQEFTVRMDSRGQTCQSAGTRRSGNQLEERPSHFFIR